MKDHVTATLRDCGVTYSCSYMVAGTFSFSHFGGEDSSPNFYRKDGKNRNSIIKFPYADFSNMSLHAYWGFGTYSFHASCQYRNR